MILTEKNCSIIVVSIDLFAPNIASCYFIDDNCIDLFYIITLKLSFDPF